VDALLSKRIGAVNAFVSRVNQQREYEAQTITRLHAKITQLEEDKTELVKAVGLIDRCIQIISANGISKIESIISGGLRLVFKDPLIGFIVEKKEGARGNSYRLLVHKGNTSGDPMTSFGGGVVNVVAFLLRVIMIKRFKLAKFLVVDESFNDVNGTQNQRRVSEMLKKMSKEHGFTIFAITGQSIFASAADTVYEVLVGENGRPLLRLMEDPNGSEHPKELASETAQ